MPPENPRGLWLVAWVCANLLGAPPVHSQSSPLDTLPIPPTGADPVLSEEISDEIPEDSPLESIALFSRALQIIRNDYVDGAKVDYRKLIYGALQGILSSLDPHSQFMEPESFKAMQDDTRDQFGGLGIKVEVRNGTLTVVAPMEDTPGARAGILSGDQIIEIDGKTTERLTLPEAVQLLRGAPGTKVILRTFRPSTKEFQKLEVLREIIKVESVQEAILLDAERTGGAKIAYLRIVQFNEPTARELRRKLDLLTDQGMEALIIDLRNNPGGLIESAVDVAAEFLPPNELVVYTEGRDPTQRRNYRTPRNYKARPWFPLVILINGGSASGSEIVAGALKDLNRAIIIGETSFGKGSVQTVQGLPDGSAMRLTTAKYYTPGKQVIHERGITPTLTVTMSESEEAAMMMRRNQDSIPEEERERINAIPDRQLETAIDVLKGVLVFRDQPRLSSQTTSGTRTTP
ncbi:MAG: S41 family peptidase [Verrucomicrobiia bacterium]